MFPGTQNGTVLRLRGEGINHSQGRGDEPRPHYCQNPGESKFQGKRINRSTLNRIRGRETKICYLNDTFIRPVSANGTSDSYGLRRNHICEDKRHYGEDFEQRKDVDVCPTSFPYFPHTISR